MAKKLDGQKAGFGTVATHAGKEMNETHAHVQPIYQSSTYWFDSVESGQAIWKEERDGYIYGRLSNPNTDATAAAIAALEGKNLTQQPYGLMCGSGMAAISTVILPMVNAADTIVSQQAIYGYSYNLFAYHLKEKGVRHVVFDGPNLDDLERVLAQTQKQGENVKVVYIETPVNPTMALTDICGVVERAHAVGARVVIDNTFATPYLQRPLEMGVDVSIHSTTKYLSGHGQVVGGAIITPHEDLYRLFRTALFHYGGVAGPMDAWLTLLGLRTLHVRMERHCENAMAVAQFLEAHPAVKRVYYPGLESFEQHELAKRQMDDFGAMLSFELQGGYAAGARLMNRVQLCELAVSLGTVDTLIQHPASMTHFRLSPEDRAAMGIGEGLARLSVGIEDVQDIIADLEQGLSE